MKVYILTNGCYSDYHIVGAYSSKEAAQRWADHIIGSDDARVEEYDVDHDHGVPRGLFPFTVLYVGMAKPFLGWKQVGWQEPRALEPQTLTPERQEWHPEESSVSAVGSIDVYAKDAKHALKIASEKRAQWIASKGVTRP